jgi:hypothetical protein
MEDEMKRYIIVEYRENHKLYFAGFDSGRFLFPNNRDKAQPLTLGVAKNMLDAVAGRDREHPYGIEPADQDPEQKLDSVIEAAKMKFWGHIADSFPEVETGDLEPLVLNRFDTVIEETVKNWYERNNKRY